MTLAANFAESHTALVPRPVRAGAAAEEATDAGAGAAGFGMNLASCVRHVCNACGGE